MRRVMADRFDGESERVRSGFRVGDGKLAINLMRGAVEVVSPGQENAARDYRYKRSEYAVCGIREYWIVDPGRGVVSVLELVEGFYEVVEFRGGDRVVSPLFGDLGVMVREVLGL